MYIYNTTFICDDSRLDEFSIWVNTEFIPKLTSSGLATSPQLAHVIPTHQKKDDEAESFSVQVHLQDIDSLETWMKDTFLPAIDAFTKRFGDKILYFPTILEILPLNNFN